MLRLLSLAFVVAVPAAPPEGLSLTGTVQDPDNKPIARAVVYVRPYGRRNETGVFCPVCYPESSKRASTDEKGRFTVSALNPDLLFRVLVTANGFQASRSLSLVDPEKGPLEITLKPHDLDKRDPKLIFVGCVRDEERAPVAGACIEPKMFMRGNMGQGGNLSRQGFDALVITDKDGLFRMRAPHEDDILTVEVTHPAYAPRVFEGLSTGADLNVLTVLRGVTVTGRIVKAKMPLPGLKIALCQTDRSYPVWLGEFQAIADAKGEFAIPNVPPEEDLLIYGRMHDFTRHGAIAERSLRSSKSGAADAVGDIEVLPGLRLAGRMELSDGKPVPAGTKVILSRGNYVDSITESTDAEGRWEFKGLPAGEQYRLTARLNGYHVSEKNASYELLNGAQLAGTIKDNTDGFRLLLDPGRAQRINYQNVDHQEYQRRLQAPLQGAPEKKK